MLVKRMCTWSAALAVLASMLVVSVPPTASAAAGDVWTLTAVEPNTFDSEQIQPNSTAEIGDGFYNHTFFDEPRAELKVRWPTLPQTLTPGEQRSITISASFVRTGAAVGGFHHADIRFGLPSIEPTLNILQGCSNINSIICQPPVLDAITVFYTVPTSGTRYSIYIRDRFCDMCTIRYVYELGDAPPTCNGKVATIGPDDASGGNLIGTSGDDVIVGTSRVDFINGKGGNDTICARGGDDIVKGGPGEDTIFGGLGDDKIRGNGANDTIDGGKGEDIILGGGGDDILRGGRRDDIIRGQNGADDIDGGPGRDDLFGAFDRLGLSGPDDGAPDTLRGGGGNDRLFGGGGRDILKGEKGLDLLYGEGGPDILRGGPGRDRLWGHTPGAARKTDDNRRDQLYGGGGPDVLTSQGGPDLLVGGPGNDELIASRGNDTLDGSGGNDTYNAGSGTDTCVADADDLAEYRGCEF